MPYRLARLAAVVALCAAPARAQDLFDLTQVRTLRLTFASSNYWSQLMAGYGSPNYIHADLEVDGVVYADVGVQMRGRAAYSCSNDKKPLKVKLDAFVPGQELYGYDSLRLNNGIGDPTYVREVILGELCAPYLAEPRRTWALVETNGVSRGVYMLEEQKDATFMRSNFGSDEGHRYYPDAPATLEYLGPNVAAYVSRYDLRTPDHPNPWFNLIEIARRLQQLPMASLATELDETFDVQSALWAFAATAVFCNWDSYMGNSNNWYYVEEGANGRGVMLQHDMNLAWGTWGSFGTSASIYTGANTASRPFAFRLLNEPSLRREYQAHVRTLRDEAFKWQRIEPLIVEFQALLDPLIQVEPSPMYPYSAFRGNLTAPSGGPCWSMPALQTFVQQREAYLAGLPELNLPRVELDQLHHWPLRPRDTDTLTVTVRASGPVAPASLTLRWRTYGRYHEEALLDDGAHGDGAAGDGIYGAQVPAHGEGAVIEYYVVAAAPAPDDARTFLPSAGSGDPRRVRVALGVRGVKITEYLYDGNSGEFVELTNTSTSPIDLAGWSLDDQSGNLGVVALGSAGILAPGASLVVTDVAVPTFEARWGLVGVPIIGPNLYATLGRADTIYVFDPAGQVQDRLEYGDERFPGTHRAKDVSASVCFEGLGAGDPYDWTPAALGDAQGSYLSSNGDLGSPGAWSSFACTPGGLGEVYCTSTPNSSGQPALLTASGSRWVADNDVTLVVEQLPVGALGYFLASLTPAHIPGIGGGPGVLCVGGAVLRLSSEIRNAGPAGRVVHAPNLMDLPGHVAVVAGETWHFQFWHRDFQPGPTSNTSAAVALTFN